MENGRLNLSNGAYEATIGIDLHEQGTAELELNTHVAGKEGREADVVSVVEGNATATLLNQTTTEDLLKPGEYDLTVGATPEGDPDHETTVTLDPRYTDSLTALSSDSLTPDDLDDAAAIEAARENETLQPTDSIADDDTLVLATAATGLTGLEGTNGSIGNVDDLAGHEGLTVEVAATENTTNGPVRADLSGSKLANASTATVTDDGLYAAVRWGDLSFENGTIADGEPLELGVGIADERLRTTDDPLDGDAIVGPGSNSTDDPDVVTTDLVYNGSALPDDGGSDGTDADGDSESDDGGAAGETSGTGGATSGGDGTENDGSGGSEDDGASVGDEPANDGEPIEDGNGTDDADIDDPDETGSDAADGAGSRSTGGGRTASGSASSGAPDGSHPDESADDAGVEELTSPNGWPYAPALPASAGIATAPDDDGQGVPWILTDGEAVGQGGSLSSWDETASMDGAAGSDGDRDDTGLSLSDLERAEDEEGSGWLTVDEVPGFGPVEVIVGLLVVLTMLAFRGRG